MKEISSQSFTKIHDLIYGQNYVNIKARLNQLLPEYYSKVFAGVKMIGAQGIWYGDDHINYQHYVLASDLEKEEIAAFLEDSKNYVCNELSTSMPYVNSLFTIPSQNEIFWYRDEEGQIRVTLAQWGFENRSNGPKVDVIGMLISIPRVHTQQDITIHIDFSDGEKASDISCLLYLFNNTKEIKTDENGNFHLGKLFLGKEFGLSAIDEDNYYSFSVVKDGKYNAVFDWKTKYLIITENENGVPIGNQEIFINGEHVITNEDGIHEEKIILKPNHNVNIRYKDTDYSFVLQREPEENVFHLKLQQEEVTTPLEPPLPQIPTSPKNISIELLDFDGQPLPDMPFTINAKGCEPIKGKTDENGIAQIEKSLFDINKKYKIFFTVTSLYREELNKIKGSDGK